MVCRNSTRSRTSPVPLDAVGPGAIARAVAARLAGAVPLRARLAARNAALLDAVRRPRRALV